MVNNTSVENIPTQFNEIISFINTINQSIIQMFGLVSFPTTGKNNFRNIGSYTNFLKLYIQYSNTLTKINRIFDTIIINIDYVTPENIQLYFSEYNEYVSQFNKFQSTFFNPNGTIKVTKYGAGGFALT